jgi:hypothetical protein
VSVASGTCPSYLSTLYFLCTFAQVLPNLCPFLPLCSGKKIV